MAILPYPASTAPPGHLALTPGLTSPPQGDLVVRHKKIKGPGARASLGHLSVWFGEHQIVVRGSNSEYKLPIYSSYVLS